MFNLHFYNNELLLQYSVLLTTKSSHSTNIPFIVNLKIYLRLLSPDIMRYSGSYRNYIIVINQQFPAFFSESAFTFYTSYSHNI